VSVWPLTFQDLERHLTDAKHYFVLVDFRAAIICALRRGRVAVAWANDLAAGAGPQAFTPIIGFAKAGERRNDRCPPLGRRLRN
jgi:hypothetical protein